MIIVYLIVLVMLIVISITHELGHMIALLSFGIPIHRLDVGFGPVIFWRNFKKSAIRRLRVRLLPLGVGAGFDGDHPRFRGVGFAGKILIFSSGILANILAAVIVTMFSGVGNVLRPLPILNALTNITRAFVVLNILAALFQLLPFARFDGGRILSYFLDRFFPQRSRDFLMNLRILIALLVAYFIFNIYRFWI